MTRAEILEGIRNAALQNVGIEVKAAFEPVLVLLIFSAVLRRAQHYLT